MIEQKITEPWSDLTCGSLFFNQSRDKPRKAELADGWLIPVHLSFGQVQDKSNCLSNYFRKRSEQEFLICNCEIPMKNSSHLQSTLARHSTTTQAGIFSSAIVVSIAILSCNGTSPSLREHLRRGIDWCPSITWGITWLL